MTKMFDKCLPLKFPNSLVRKWTIQPESLVSFAQLTQMYKKSRLTWRKWSLLKWKASFTAQLWRTREQRQQALSAGDLPFACSTDKVLRLATAKNMRRLSFSESPILAGDMVWNSDRNTKTTNGWHNGSIVNILISLVRPTIADEFVTPNVRKWYLHRLLLCCSETKHSSSAQHTHRTQQASRIKGA